MRYVSDQRVEDLKVAYIGGGSRGWAWGFMTDIAMDEQLQGTVRLYDIDKPAAERNKVIGEKISAMPEIKSRWAYEVSDSLQEALTGADFVVISILPGTFEEMRSDVHAPEAYGIYQSVGDTIGPGGFMRALRTIPMFVEIAEAIKAYAPDAWVINYTNPMTLCVRTLYEVYPEIKAFGCCHEVFGTQKLLCAMLEKNGIPGVKRQDLHTTVTGINHFTWITGATYKNINLMPMYKDFVDQYYADGFHEGKDENWMNSFFNCAHRVKFDLFRKYGAIAAAGDRHLAEFMPHAWYLRDPETVKSWKFTLTPVSWRMEDLKRRYQRSDDLISGKETVDLDGSGEEGHLLLKAILGLGDLVSNVNVPNRGQIPNLPIGAVVETNALFGRDRIQPVYAGPAPANLLPLFTRHIYNQENTLRAAMTCDRELAFTTFMNDPQMIVTPEEGQKLFNQMLEAQRKYLPKQWF